MAKTRNALRNQRPQKRKKLVSAKIIGLASILLASTALSWYTIRSIDFSFNKESKSPTPIKWHVQVEGEKQSSKHLKEIHLTLAEACPNGRPKEIKFAAQLLQTRLEVDRVRLVRTGHDQLYLYIKPRKPYLRIFTGKVRLLSETGQIYGLALPNHENLPMLKGIPIENASWRSDGTLHIAKESEQLINQALELVKLARSFRAEIDAVSYIPYRGFSFTRASDNIEAVVGFSPFDEKLDRLLKLVGSLKKKGSHVERIELDYQGKAFIKEKKS